MFVVERVISLVAPHNCLNCDDEGKLLCAWCLPDAFAAVPPRCYKCYRETENSLVCKRCRKTVRLKHVWVATEYEGLAKELVHKFKYERAQAAAQIIAEAVFGQLPYFADSLLVPIPTASLRRRARGYDHTKLVSKHLARFIGLEYKPALARLGQSRQVGSKRTKRQAQMKDAFRLVDTNSIYKKD